MNKQYLRLCCVSLPHVRQTVCLQLAAEDLAARVGSSIEFPASVKLNVSFD